MFHWTPFTVILQRVVAKKKRWAHNSFDSASCFASYSNLGDVLEKLRDMRTEIVSTSQHQNRSQHFVPHWVLYGSRACFTSPVIISQSFPLRIFLQCFFLNDMCAMASSDSCVSTASCSDEIFAHNIWNPKMEKELLKPNCLKPNSIRGGFLRNEKII